MNTIIKSNLFKFIVTDTSITQKSFPNIVIDFKDITDLTYSAPTKWVNGTMHIYSGSKHILICVKKSNVDIISKFYNELKSTLVTENLTSSKYNNFISEINKIPDISVLGSAPYLKSLFKTLYEGEKVKSILRGNMDGDDVTAACTDRRILFIKYNLTRVLELSEVSLDSVISITQKLDAFTSEVLIQSQAGSKTIEKIIGKNNSHFIEEVNKHRNAILTKRSQPVTVTQSNNSSSTADEIMKFKKLLDMGAITQEEFDIKKKQLLGL